MDTFHNAKSFASSSKKNSNEKVSLTFVIVDSLYLWLNNNMWLNLILEHQNSNVYIV